MIRKYDHIFFDLDHTLWDFTANSRQALKQTLDKYKITEQLNSFEDFQSAYESINEKLWEDYRKKEISKFLLTSKRFTMSLEQFGINNFDSQELNDCYLNFMAEQTSLFPGTVKTLTHLKTKGYQMHIITNGFKEVQTRKLKTSGLGQFISNIFISEVVQSPKPEKGIFEYALKSSNAKKTRSIMIGDNWEVDILGALNFGIDQVMFLNGNLSSVPPEISEQISHSSSVSHIRQRQNKTYFIQQIEELKEIL